MTYKEYYKSLNAQGKIAFAERIGIGRSVLSLYNSGLKKPSLKRCQKIIEASNHIIEFKSLRPDMYAILQELKVV